jgi:hypothetical protein
MVTARLILKRWFRRTWVLQLPDRAHTISYNGWGIGSESVSVDGGVVVRRRGLGGMSHSFRLFLDDARFVAVSVAIPWWCNVLPLGDLSFVQLEVDGETLYQEGRPPKRELPLTAAARAFAVIPVRPPLPPPTGANGPRV